MSRGREYPRLGGSGRLKPTQMAGPCAACDDLLATSYVEVQEGWFRGDDTVLHVCPDHLAMARRNLPGDPPRPCFNDFDRLCAETWKRRNPEASKADDEKWAVKKEKERVARELLGLRAAAADAMGTGARLTPSPEQQFAALLADPKRELFTLAMQNGDVYVLDVTAMRAHVAAQKAGTGALRIPLDEPLKAHIAKTYHDPARQVNAEKFREPALAIQMEDRTTNIVDGRHRIAEWIRRELDHGLLIEFAWGAWQPYLLALPPDVIEYLRADTMAERKET